MSRGQPPRPIPFRLELRTTARQCGPFRLRAHAPLLVSHLLRRLRFACGERARRPANSLNLVNARLDLREAFRREPQELAELVHMEVLIRSDLELLYQLRTRA